MARTGLKVFVDCVPSMRGLTALARDVLGPRAQARSLHHPAGVLVSSDPERPGAVVLAARTGGRDVSKVLMRAMLEGLAHSGEVSHG